MLATLVVASICLYAGGVALNDVCDADIDARQRPDRPIPSGRIALGAARRSAVALLCAGVVLAWLASPRAGVLAFALLASIVLYDAVLKDTPLAPPLMGLCRALNFLLPLASLGGSILSTAALTPAALIWLYITSVTYFARREAIGATRWSLTGGTIGVCLAVVGLAALRWIVAQPHDAYLIAVIALAGVLGYHGFVCVRRPEPAVIQRGVKVFVIGLIGFDACIAWASRGSIAGLLVAALLIPTVGLGSGRRAFRVT